MGVVAVTDHVFADLEQERRLLGDAGHELRFERHASAPSDVLEVARGADAVLNCYAPIPAEVIHALEGCRIIARYGIGVDTIDIEAASEAGMFVTNVPDYCIDEVSDHALALILALRRGVVRLDRSVRGGAWSPMEARPLHRIRGGVLGLVGFGRIARALAAKAAALGFRVMASDPYLRAEDIASAGAEPSTLEELLESADVVSVHAPLTPETRHMIGAEQLARMRQGSFLVNTSRGPLVDLDALRRALDEGRLGGAGLDVLEDEPPRSDDSLLHRSDVVVTPHAAFYSEEAMAEQQRKAAEQVIAALAGEVPPYAVNADALG